MLGAFIGSGRGNIYIGEFGGFYLTKVIVPREYGKIDSPLKKKYIRALQHHAAQFVAEELERTGATFFVESTPWNLHIGDYLCKVC